MGIFSKNIKSDPVTVFKMVTENGNGFYNWNGNLYSSDIIRACIRPAARSVGKMVAKHVRKEYKKDDEQATIRLNPEAYIRFVLEEPNAYMTGQVMQEKIINQLMLNNNAFIVVIRDDNGLVNQLYPVPCSGAQNKYDENGILYLKFTLKNGTFLTRPYTDIIHIRQDFNENDLFGTSPMKALEPVMEVITTTDQGVIKAIKNSAIVKWLLKFKSVLTPEDTDKQVKEFISNYLSIDSKNVGAAATDPRYEAVQVEPYSYVPNAAQMDRAITRIYNFFNVNIDIVQSKAKEDIWNAYYESVLEPIAIQLSGEYTRKLFTRTERSYGNKIIFDSATLQTASMSTKLGLVAAVDRGMMTPNEWRTIFNMGPIEGGEKAIRRLDTAVVETKVEGGD